MQSISSKELFRKILSSEPLFILDVRNNEEYKDWKIEGRSVVSLNVPYFQFLDGVEEHLTKLPANQPIVVVCAKEGSSVFVAEQLRDAGVDAYYLKGGMKEWSQFYQPVTVAEEGSFKVIQINRVAKGCLSYLIVSGDEGVVVDPGRHIDEYLELAKQEGVTITHILDSHLHADHISGAKELMEKSHAKYFLMKSEGATFDHEPLEDYDRIEWNGVTVDVLAVKTPWHTPGSVSFLINDKYLLSGDTIFVSGLGRPDLGGKVREWGQSLYETVFGKISLLADDVVVLPAHFADITTEMNEQGTIMERLGVIRSNNELMQQSDREVFLDSVEQSASTVKPPNFEKIVGINRGEYAPSMDESVELEVGPNRCAVHHAHSATA